MERLERGLVQVYRVLTCAAISNMPPPSKPNTRHNSASQDSMSVDDKLDLLLNDVSQIKEDNKQCLNDIASIRSEIVSFKEDIGRTVDMCFSELKDCQSGISVNSAAISTCQTNIDDMKSENVQLKKTVSDLRKRLSASEQYSRSNCLEIVGVPEVENENIMFVLRQIAGVLNFKLEDGMIDAVHRLSKNTSKPSEPRAIIVKFCRRLDMEEMRRRSRVKRSFSASELGLNSEKRVFINLSLSRESRQLWAEVKRFKERHHYKYAWISSAGKIFLRKDQGQSAIFISEVSDLHELN